VRVKPLDNVTLRIETEPWAKLRVTSRLVNTTLESNGDGLAVLRFRVEPGVGEGVYTVLVAVEPRGLMGPASQTVKVTVERVEPNVLVEAPSYAIAGLKLEARVYVNVSSRVTLCIEGVKCSTSVGLEVRESLGIPVGYVGSSLKLVIRVEPLSPSYRPVERVLEVRVLNPLVAIPAIALVASTPWLASRWIKSKRVVTIVVEGPVGAQAEAQQMEGRGGGILWELAETIRRLYGVAMRGSDTLREYLAKLRVLPASIYRVLEEAFTALERALYGRPELAEQFKARALELLRRVLEALRGGAR